MSELGPACGGKAASTAIDEGLVKGAARLSVRWQYHCPKRSWKFPQLTGVLGRSAACSPHGASPRAPSRVREELGAFLEAVKSKNGVRRHCREHGIEHRSSSRTIPGPTVRSSG
jgi:hypothetical protein